LTTTSPSSKLAVGIDVGTSGARVIISDEFGRQVSTGDAPILTPRNSPFCWWQACTQALQKALSTLLDRKAIVSIAIDATSGTLLAVDQQGTPIGDALMYDQSARDVRFNQLISEFAPTGSPASSSTSGLGKALDFQHNTRAAKIIHQADWLLGQFCGEYHHSDENNALKTAWIEQTQMDLALLPEVHPIATPVGCVTKATARKFGLATDTLVCTGTTDGCASFLATGAEQLGDGVTSLGTTMTLKQLVSSPVFDADYGVYSHRLGDLWLAGGASNTGGAVLDAFFTGAELNELSALINTKTRLNLHYYPLLNTGERFPINDPMLVPKLTPKPDDKSIFLHAVFEGMADIEKLGYDRVEALCGTALTSVRTVGGGAANKQWTQIREMTLCVPSKPTQSIQAAAGTARLAWQGYHAA